MSFVGKSSMVIACLCILNLGAFGQKNVTKAAKVLAAKPSVLQPRPPLAQAAKVPPLRQVLQQNLMKNWDMTLQHEVERTNLEQLTRQHPLSDTLHAQYKENFVSSKLKIITDYLSAHQNRWPQYNQDADANRVLHHIAGLMEVAQPSPEEQAVQREIIRLREASEARTPYEVARLVGNLMEYGIVPMRAKPGVSEQDYSDEEIALGEDLAFAIAAHNVSMRHNPWKKISGFNRLKDIAHTYAAMRRQNSSSAIPTTYVGNGAIHYPNIPLFTQKQYLQEQHKFATAHPFEYVLAPYWERTFGASIHRVFNSLSDVEKNAILFSAPQLPQSVQVDSDVFALCYDHALVQWMNRHQRQPNHYAGSDRVPQLIQFLKAQPGTMPTFLFRVDGVMVAFSDLNYKQQSEVLMWVWQNLHLLPSKALKLLEREDGSYF